MTATLLVCATCRSAEAEPSETDDADAPRAGERLYDALASDPPEGVTVVAVECLSACKAGCNAALTAPGKWSYVYERLGEAHLDDIREGAAAYAASADGVVPWRQRPQVFRKQVRARVPPISIPKVAS